MADTTEDKSTSAVLVDAVRETTKAQPAEEKPEDTTPPAEDTDKGSEKPSETLRADSEKGSDTPPVLAKDDGTPYTKADIDGLQTALKAARKEAKDTARELAELKAKGGDRPLDEVLAEADSTAAAKWKPLMVRNAARAAFAEAGLTLPDGRQDEAFARAVRLLDDDALTISDAGVVEGLAEQVQSIRGDFPDLFNAGPARKPRIQAADRPSGPKPPASTAETLAAQLAGRS